MVSSNPYDYARVKVNGKSYIEDLIIELNTIEKDIKQLLIVYLDKELNIEAGNIMEIVEYLMENGL